MIELEMTSASFFKSSRAFGPGGVTMILGAVTLAVAMVAFKKLH
jgi:hypothetical protein